MSDFKVGDVVKGKKPYEYVDAFTILKIEGDKLWDHEGYLTSNNAELVTPPREEAEDWKKKFPIGSKWRSQRGDTCVITDHIVGDSARSLHSCFRAAHANNLTLWHDADGKCNLDESKYDLISRIDQITVSASELDLSKAENGDVVAVDNLDAGIKTVKTGGYAHVYNQTDKPVTVRHDGGAVTLAAGSTWSYKINPELEPPTLLDRLKDKIVYDEPKPVQNPGTASVAVQYKRIEDEPKPVQNPGVLESATGSPLHWPDLREQKKPESFVLTTNADREVNNRSAMARLDVRDALKRLTTTKQEFGLTNNADRRAMIPELLAVQKLAGELVKKIEGSL